MGFVYPNGESDCMRDVIDLTRLAYGSAERAKIAVECQNWDVGLNESDIAVKNLLSLYNVVQNKLLEAWYCRAKSYLGQNKFFRAKQDCQFMIDLKHGRTGFIVTHNYEQESKWCTAIGQAYTGMNQLEMAKDAYRKALLLDCNNRAAKDSLSQIFDVQNALANTANLWKLPDELWVRIFGFLDIKTRVQVECVCKKWQKLAPFSWKFVTNVPGDWWPAALITSSGLRNPAASPIKPEYFGGLIKKCGPWCKIIDLGCVDVSRVRLVGEGRFRLRNKLKQLLAIVCQNCPNLTSLNVPSAALLDEDLNEIFRHLPHLRFLCLEKVCRTPEGRLDGQAFGNAPITLKDIRLHFAASTPCLSDSALHRLADRLGPHLKHLKLCSDWDSFCSEQAVSHLLDACCNLTTIKLGCLGREGGERLTSSCLVRLGLLRNLTTLYLWVVRISSAVVGSLVQGCQKLISLELHAEIMDSDALAEISNFRNMNDLRLDVISGLLWASLLPQYSLNNSNTLKILALSGLNATEMFMALEIFPALEQLCMWNSVNVTPPTLIALIDRYKSNRRNPLKLIASCYHVQIDQPLANALKETPQFSLGCYYDHHPCDLVFNR